MDRSYLRLRISLWALALTEPEIGELDSAFIIEYSAVLRGLISEARPNLDSDEASDRASDVVAFASGVWLGWARFGDVNKVERGLNRCVSLALGS